MITGVEDAHGAFALVLEGHRRRGREEHGPVEEGCRVSATARGGQVLRAWERAHGGTNAQRDEGQCGGGAHPVPPRCALAPAPPSPFPSAPSSRAKSQRAITRPSSLPRWHCSGEEGPSPGQSSCFGPLLRPLFLSPSLRARPLPHQTACVASPPSPPVLFSSLVPAHPCFACRFPLRTARPKATRVANGDSPEAARQTPALKRHGRHSVTVPKRSGVAMPISWGKGGWGATCNSRNTGR